MATATVASVTVPTPEEPAGQNAPVVAPAPAGASTASTSGDAAADTAPTGPTALGTSTAQVGSSGAGGSQSGGAGNPGAGTGAAGAPAGDGVTEVTALGSGTGSVPTAAATPVAASGSTGAAAALPVGSQVARHVAVLLGGPDGTQTMTLVLNPESLGPVEVSVTLTKGSVDLTLRGAHEFGRAALLDGLSDLRRDLESVGLTCSRLEVDQDTGGSWLARHSAQQQADAQAFGHRGGQPDRGDRSRPWGAPADTAVSGPTPRNRSTSSGVDLLV
jgi:flagellar hook-length control protein FliK